MVKFLNTYKYAIITVTVVLGCVAYYFVNPAQYEIVPKCPVKLLTTLDCPGCGFQRALHAALHGHFTEAIHYNQFLLVAIPITFLWCFNGMILENTSHRNRKIVLIKVNKGLIYFYILCYICWFVIRNVH